MVRPADMGIQRRPSVASVRDTVITLGCLVLFAIDVHAGFSAGSVPAKPHLVHYTVDNGDTVWGISERIAQADGDNPEAVQDTVIQVNGLQDGQVWPGEDILVPMNGGK